VSGGWEAWKLGGWEYGRRRIEDRCQKVRRSEGEKVRRSEC